MQLKTCVLLLAVALFVGSGLAQVPAPEVEIIEIDDIDAPVNDIGDTALHIAAANRETDKVKDLLAQGASPSVTNDDGDTPLHYAAWNGAGPVVPILIDAGGAVDAQDNGGETALHKAAKRGNVDIVKVLLDRGASKTLETPWGATAFDLICKQPRKSACPKPLLERLLQP